uniref:Major facilitator superfamily (MFS) profile domain-containing protein n=1 Tax=Chromera velia CCMP2878 TaxID=1169474 RepID=A0A0G4FUK3_9ALVE|eukprot:Cvel_18857.t1-p1 / transcript=Cvel_18857.t1 / gene=Cvel_18857 / organism=Chromera_velia_CCMP2878 / gene_product=hypothetical protein / transcript_product=hypothetical protein / location=Cvel_scaffold1586:13518-20131(-) / protein_length=682 / sequence_SO=supercontig / SO=protein_coding / is_pseudo=false
MTGLETERSQATGGCRTSAYVQFCAVFFGLCANLPWNAMLNAIPLVDMYCFPGFGWALLMSWAFSISSLLAQIAMLCVGDQLSVSLRFRGTFLLMGLLLLAFPPCVIVGRGTLTGIHIASAISFALALAAACCLSTGLGCLSMVEPALCALHNGGSGLAGLFSLAAMLLLRVLVPNGPPQQHGGGSTGAGGDYGNSVEVWHAQASCMLFFAACTAAVMTGIVMYGPFEKDPAVAATMKALSASTEERAEGTSSESVCDWNSSEKGRGEREPLLSLCSSKKSLGGWGGGGSTESTNYGGVSADASRSVQEELKRDSSRQSGSSFVSETGEGTEAISVSVPSTAREGMGREKAVGVSQESGGTGEEASLSYFPSDPSLLTGEVERRESASSSDGGLLAASGRSAENTLGAGVCRMSPSVSSGGLAHTVSLTGSQSEDLTGPVPLPQSGTCSTLPLALSGSESEAESRTVMRTRGGASRASSSREVKMAVLAERTVPRENVNSALWNCRIELTIVLVQNLVTFLVFPGVISRLKPGEASAVASANAELFALCMIGAYQIGDSIGRVLPYFGLTPSTAMQGFLLTIRLCLVPFFLIDFGSLRSFQDVLRPSVLSAMKCSPALLGGSCAFALLQGLGLSAAMVAGPGRMQTAEGRQLAGFAASVSMQTGVLVGVALSPLVAGSGGGN